VLEALLLRPGELVTREELKQKLWPSDTFGDFEHGLNAAVNRVREALGDSSDNPRFVETVPPRGYRFIGPIGQKEPESKRSSGAAPSLDGQGLSTADTQPPSTPKSRWIPAVAFLLLLIAVGTLLFMRLRNRPSRVAADQENLRVTPLTTLPGTQTNPSFSPDGSQVVFAWDGGNSNATNPFNLYVKVIGSEKVDQLTHEPGGWIVPAWSPDGSTIAFVRQGGEKEGIFSISPRGGPERKLAEGARAPTIQWDDRGLMSLSWSSDGRQLVYYTNDGLRVLTLESGEVRPVDTRQCWPYTPGFSPDGKWIAFTCDDTMTGVFYLDLLPVKGGAAKHLFRFTAWGGGQIAWTNDSQRIVIDGLWEININGGEPHPLLSADSAFETAIALRGKRLAYVAGQNTTNIWRADTRTGLPRTVLAPSIVLQRNPDISPDGKRIAFESERSGFNEVWVANLDGSDVLQLSNFHRAALTGSPRWSPDGRWIVFDSRVSGRAAIYIVDPGTATPRQVSTSGIPAAMPSWSTDGKWIYLSSQPSDRPSSTLFIGYLSKEEFPSAWHEATAIERRPTALLCRRKRTRRRKCIDIRLEYLQRRTACAQRNAECRMRERLGVGFQRHFLYRVDSKAGHRFLRLFIAASYAKDFARPAPR
jgi:Tol biopolymer transport system component/DNA-binding winged helix-turn-helix (wHTH) protein